MAMATIDKFPRTKALALRTLAALEAEHGGFADVVETGLAEDTLKLLARAGLVTTRRDQRGGPLFARLTDKGRAAAQVAS